MLPFLKKIKHETGVIVRDRKPDGSTTESGMEGQEDQGLTSAAEDLCRAIKSDNYQAAAEALRAAFEILDAQPHHEGEHIDGEEE